MAPKPVGAPVAAGANSAVVRQGVKRHEPLGPVIAADIERVLRSGDAGVGHQDPEGFVGDTAIGDVIERVAPRVVQVKGEARSESTLQADAEAVVVGDAGGKVLVHRTQRGVGRRSGQTGKTTGADSRCAIGIQALIRHRNVNAVHTRIINREDHVGRKLVRNLEIPLIVSRLVEGIREGTEIRRRESGNKLRYRVKAPA